MTKPPIRVLIVEDEALIAMILEEMIVDAGCAIAGTAATLDAALEIVTKASDIDCALLDINLRGAPSWPIADALAARDIPFAFVSGYGQAGLDPRYRDAKVLAKPIDSAQLEAWLQSTASREA